MATSGSSEQGGGKGLKVVGGVFLVAGLALTWLATGDLVGEMRLRADHRVVEATVLETRTTQRGRSGTDYDLRYRFTPPGSTTSYTATDGTGRENLWVGMSSFASWDEARRTRRVEVMYLAGDPSVNRPVKVGAAPVGDKIAGGVAGLFFAGLGGLMVATSGRARAAARDAAATPPT